MADDKIQGVPEGLQEEPLMNTTGISGVPEGVTEEPLHMAGAGGSWEAPESTVSKVWKGANTPLVPEGRAEKEGHALAESAPTLEESEHPIRTGLKKGLAGAYADTAEMARGLTSPLGIATLGLGEVGEAPGALGRIGKAGSRIAGAGFGASGAQEAGTGAKDIYEHGATPENLKQTLSGAGMAALGTTGAIHGTELVEQPAKKALSAPVRATARMLTPIQKALPTALGMIGGEAVGHPYYGAAVGRALLPTDMLEGPLSKGRVLGLSPEEANITHLEERLKEAEKDAKPAQEAYDAHTAGRQRGIPAPDDVLKAHEKAQTALQTAREHLQAAQEDMASKKSPAAPEQPIGLSPEQQAAQDARTTPSPTNEEINARQEKLMSDLEEKAGVPKTEKTPENVKIPGQVQPETFPQEPTAVPRVDETTRMRPLAGNQGTLLGSIPKRLTEGTPEVSIEPKTPLGEILPPEKPAKPGRLGTLRAEGGKVVDTETELQQKLEEGLQGKSKPAVKEKPESPTIIEGRPVEESKTEPKKFEEALPKHEDVESTPEDMSKVEQTIKDHTDQDLVRLGKKYGVDESEYDFSKRDEKRHRVERDDFVNDVLSKMPKADIDNIAKLSDEFDSKDESTWTSAERNALSKAQRARAIMQEHEGGGPKTVSGGTDHDYDYGYEPKETVGTEEGSKADTEYMSQAKANKPEATLSEQLQEAQRLKDAAKAPVSDVRIQVGIHNTNGGSTFSPKNGNLKGKPYFAVGGEPEFRNPDLKMKVKGGELTDEQLKKFSERPEVKEALAKHADASIGSWHDQAEDNTVVELVKTPTNRDEAIKMGTANGEKAIYDLKEGKEIPIGGTGEGPKADNITLHHWSSVDALKETDPEKFGTGKAGAEKARSKEEGFLPRTYFADAEYKEPLIQGQKNHYTAEVDPDKFYDIAKDSKGIWQEGLKEGPTAAENAVHDAGYQGYKHDGAYVSFSKQTVKPFEESAKKVEFDANKFRTQTGESPKQVTKNASGESSASQEQINRTKSEKNQGIKYYREDTRSGNRIPILSTGAGDAVAGPYENIVKSGPDGETTMDSGNKVRPMGRIKQRG